MGKATRASKPRAAVRRLVGREIQRRARGLYAELVEVVGAYYRLAARYERLVATVDVFWDDLAPIDDALSEVHEQLGLRAVLEALEAAARRFEETGLDPFASGRRDRSGWAAPSLEVLREAGSRIGHRQGRSGHDEPDNSLE